MKKIVTDVHTFDITGGAVSTAARRFINITMNYGLARKHFKPDIYDITTGEGEQRGEIRARITELRKAIINQRFSPKTIEACALPEHIEKIDNGKVTINLNDTPCPLLNGFQRFEALESIRAEGGAGSALERLVDNLPIPILITLNPEKRKEDFLNYNNEKPVHRSHMLQLKIDAGLVNPNHAPYFKQARELVLMLNSNEELPFYDIIQLDQTSSAPLSANVLMTERKTDQIASLFGASRLIKVTDTDNDWYIDILSRVHDVIKNRTNAFDAGKLLEFPDQNLGGRYKSGASFFIGVVNIFVYYLYISNKKAIDKAAEIELENSVDVFDNFVDGDATNKRRASIMLEFSQKLFKNFLSDPHCKISAHKGIPHTIITFFSPGSFGVDPPTIPPKPTQTMKKGSGRKKKAKMAIEEIQCRDIIASAGTARADSDTAPDWTDDEGEGT